MKLAMAVAEAPIRLRTTLKLGTESPMNKANRTIILRNNTRFQVNSGTECTCVNSLNSHTNLGEKTSSNTKLCNFFCLTVGYVEE